jgi:hypothetical protein
MRLLQIVSPFQNLFDARAKVAVESSVDYRDAGPPGRHLVPMRLRNTPLWLYFKSVRSSEKSVKL